jgi:predicted phosphodiesterase
MAYLSTVNITPARKGSRDDGLKMARYESPDTVKRRNAHPDRMKKRQTQGSIWQAIHKDLVNERDRARGPHSGMYAQMIDEARDPITIESDNIAITSDWHLPFVDERLLKRLFEAAEEHDTKEMIIAGDFWDCDNYSRFTCLTESGVKISQTFTGEIDEVKKMMSRILNVFDKLYFCRGNHEKRWIDLNAGKMGMKELFALAKPSNLSEDAFNERVKITQDDHINLISHGQLWLCCHPRNFRITPLSVARDLSAKHLCNAIIAHGHAFNQGRDRSGVFRVADGGGMFERAALDYTRETTCHPMTRSGFFILKDNVLIPFEGEA